MSAPADVTSALAASEARFRELWENANDILYTHDLAGRFTDVNAAAVAAFGYTRQEFLGLNIKDLVDPAHLAVAQANLQAKVTGGQERTPPYDLLTRAKDGSPVWVEVSTRIVREHGKPVAVHGIVRNVTRRKAEEARVAFIQDLAQALNHAKDFTDALQATLDKVCAATGWAYGEAWVPDSQGLMKCSKAWHAGKPGLEKFRHLSQSMRFERNEGLAGELWTRRRALPVPDLQQHQTLRRQAAAQAAGLNSLVAVPVVDGDESVADLIFMHGHWRAEDGRWASLLDAVASQLGAILALRRREDLLNRQTRLYRAQLRTNPVPAVAADARGNLLWANQRFLDLGEVAFKDATRFGASGVRFLDLVDKPQALNDLVERLCQGAAHGLRLGGRVFERHEAPMVDDGAVLGHVWYFFDVTERDLALAKAAGRR